MESQQSNSEQTGQCVDTRKEYQRPKVESLPLTAVVRGSSGGSFDFDENGKAP